MLIKGWLFMGVLSLAAPVQAQNQVPAVVNVSRINASIKVDEGQRAGKLDTVNGAIHIGAKARVEEATTVNGSIRVGTAAQVGSLGAVNGSIQVKAQAKVEGDIVVVNGSIRLAPGVQVQGQVGNVNGSIVLDGAEVHGELRTTSGSILLKNGAVVDGGVLIKAHHSWLAAWFPIFQKKPRVVIGPGSTVRGTLRFERPVALYISKQAKVGKIEGAKAVYFDGTTPSGD